MDPEAAGGVSAVAFVAPLSLGASHSSPPAHLPYMMSELLSVVGTLGPPGYHPCS